MSDFYLIAGSGVPTETKISWTASRTGRDISFGHNGWNGWAPANDLAFEVGGNTWSCSGPLTKTTIKEMRGLWIGVAPAASLKKSHVLGVPSSPPEVDTIVDLAFVEAMSSFDDRLFDFTQVYQVWDHSNNCPPWDGDFFIATLRPLIPSYDLDRSQITPNERVAERYKGKYSSYGPARCLKASAAAKHQIWRDAYTREVFCSEDAKIVMSALEIPEWRFWPMEISN